jgi:hypothetical protein
VWAASAALSMSENKYSRRVKPSVRGTSYHILICSERSESASDPALATIGQPLA